MFDEDDFIRRCLRPLAAVPGSAGLTDDAAVIDFPAGESIVVTTDMIVRAAKEMTETVSA